jgi:hypothetical protein
MEKNIIESIVIPETPKVLPNEKLHVYIPIATVDAKGIASYNEEDFDVIDGKVFLKVLPAGTTVTVNGQAVKIFDADTVMTETEADEKYLPKPKEEYSSYRNVVMKLYQKNRDTGETDTLTVLTNGTFGFTYVQATGGVNLALRKASDLDIDEQWNSSYPICVDKLSRAVKVGVTKNFDNLTDEEKYLAQAWLGLEDSLTKAEADEVYTEKTDSIESAATYRDYLETFNLGANTPLTGTSYTYTKNSDGTSYAVSCSNKSTCKIATIPSTYTVNNTTYPVTRLVANAFKNCPELLEVRIPDSVISVGANAFENCPKLQRVDFGNGLQTIGDSMFKSCGLKSIKIPETITSIGVNAFDGCTALTEIFMVSPTPPALADVSVFDNTPLAKIYVFPEYESTYKNAENWGPYADKIVADRLKLEFMFMSESLAKYCRDNFFPRINTAQQSRSVCELPLIVDKDRTTTMVIQNSNILGFNVVSSSGGYNFAIGVAPNSNIERRVDRATIGPTNIDRAIYYGITGRRRPTWASEGQEITYGNQVALNDEEKASVQAWLGVKKYYTHALIFHKSGSLSFTVDRITSEPTAYLNCTTPMAENLFCTNSKSIVLNGITDISGVKSGVGTLMATMTPYDDANGENSGVALSGVWINYSTGEVSQLTNFQVPFEQDVVTEI